MELKVKKLRADALMPKYATPGAACFDLHALEGGELGAYGGTAEFSLGLAFEVPADFVLLIFSRSGHGFKNGVRLANCTGIIDSDYRGEVAVKLRNDGSLRFDVKPGDRIAQGMLVHSPQVALIEADDISKTERGTGGFGSTGTAAF